MNDIRLCALLVSLVACSSEAAPRVATEDWQAHRQLRIGEVSGDAMKEFGLVTDVLKLRDGSIVVADHQALEARVFSGEGAYLLSIGGKGRGPGEFMGLTRLSRLAGDTIIAGNYLKTVVFSPDGSYVRERLNDWTGTVNRPMFIETHYPLDDRMFILYAMTSSSGQTGERPLSRSPIMYLVADAEAGTRDTLSLFLGSEQMTYRDGEGSHAAAPLFPARTILMLGTDHVVAGDQAADSVLVYDIAARRRSWVRLPLEAQPIPEAVRNNAYETACDWTSDEERRRRCEISLRVPPEQAQFPVFEDVAVDSAGSIWLKQYSSVPNPQSATWLIVRPSGEALAKIRLPPDLRLLQIGDSYIVGLVRDNLGVQFVEEYVIAK